MSCEFCSIFCWNKSSKTDDEFDILMQYIDKFSNKDYETEAMLNLHQKFTELASENFPQPPDLPVELIIKIISFLNDIKDLRNCMLLSREIRDLIFKTPEIMRKIVIKLSSSKDNQIHSRGLEFLNCKGKYIRCLNYNFNERLELGSVLKKVLNLEEFSCSGSRFGLFEGQMASFIENRIELTNLKVLKIQSSILESFTKITKNVKNLEKMTIFLNNQEIDDKFTDFICQQDNLKTLKITNDSLISTLSFPHRDISTEVKFRLKILKLSRIKFQSLKNFLYTQIESLKELEVTEVYDQELEILFKKSKKLRKMSLGSQACFHIFSTSFSNLELKSLKILKAKNSDSLELDKIYEKFPNLDTLKCLELKKIDGIYDKIFTLNLWKLDCQKFQNMKLPNLKNLTIVIVSKIFDENLWKKFTENTENVENFTIKYVEYSLNVHYILKYLKNFKNLKIFKFKKFCIKKYDRSAMKDFSFYEDYEIYVDTNKKMVKILRSNIEKEQEILGILSWIGQQELNF